MPKNIFLSKIVKNNIKIIVKVQHPWFKHLFEVIPAPMNAHATEIHKKKQLKAPYFPYLIKLKVKAPTAKSGVIIQNTMS